jgi:hypothetical protein
MYCIEIYDLDSVDMDEDYDSNKFSCLGYIFTF